MRVAADFLTRIGCQRRPADAMQATTRLARYVSTSSIWHHSSSSSSSSSSPSLLSSTRSSQSPPPSQHQRFNPFDAEHSVHRVSEHQPAQRHKQHSPGPTGGSLAGLRGPAAAGGTGQRSGERQGKDPAAMSADEVREAATTRLQEHNVLSGLSVGARAIELAAADGFRLSNGSVIDGGDGVVVYGGEAFRWRPWLARRRPGDDVGWKGKGDGDGNGAAVFRLQNSAGQWDPDPAAFEFFEHLWPRPEFLIIGTGNSIVPLSPRLYMYLASLGIRVTAVDTNHAAVEYNIVGADRGIHEVAVALIPFGWKEGLGANVKARSKTAGGSVADEKHEDIL